MKRYELRRSPTQQQETYATETGDARKRAAQLRKEGHSVNVSYLGPNADGVKMSQVVIHNVPAGVEIPAPR